MGKLDIQNNGKTGYTKTIWIAIITLNNTEQRTAVIWS